MGDEGSLSRRLTLLNSDEYFEKAFAVFKGPVDRLSGTFMSDRVGLEKLRDGVRLGERMGTAGVVMVPNLSLGFSPNVPETQFEPEELIVVTEVEGVCNDVDVDLDILQRDELPDP